MRTLTMMMARSCLLAGLFGGLLSSAACRSTAPAEDVSWAFLGVYEIGEVTGFENAEPRSDVRVELRLEITSYGADVDDAVLTLHDSLQPRHSYGEVGPIRLTAGAPTAVRGIFTVPRREYEDWLAGAPPRLELEFRDATNELVRFPVPVMPGTVGEED